MPHRWYLDRGLVAGLLLTLLTPLAGPPCAAAQSAAGPDAAQAVLKTQEFKFSYQGFESFYSCDGIEGKVKRLLLALGATPDLKVEASACVSGSELSSELVRSNGRSASGAVVAIRVTSPVEATPEVLAELAQTRSQRELAARVRGNSEAAAEAETQFLAPWKPVSLSRGSQGIEPGDCELVEALRKQVLPKLGVRIVKENLRCLGRQGSRSQPFLEVEALMAPPPAANAAGTAAAGSDAAAAKQAKP